MSRSRFKRKKRYLMNNDRIYRNFNIKKLEEKVNNGTITFAEKIELDNLKRAKRRFKKGRWK